MGTTSLEVCHLAKMILSNVIKTALKHVHTDTWIHTFSNSASLCQQSKFLSLKEHS